jgi:hypothetical protein
MSAPNVASPTDFALYSAMVNQLASGVGGKVPDYGAGGIGAGVRTAPPLAAVAAGMGEPGWVASMIEETKETNDWLEGILGALQQLGVNLDPDQIAALGYRRGTARAMQSDLAGRF